MMSRLILLLFFLLILAGLYSCDTGLQGNLNENQPPKTFLTVNEINLEEGTRLVSQVNISWWGDDSDGYVVGFEFAITESDWEYTPATEDEVDWVYTENTDSTFVLPIPPGESAADVRFTVRAVDNDGLRDPEGASVIFPIENSPPDISLHRTATAQHDLEVPPDTTFHIASFGWTATDPDGDDNLSHYEVVINDTLSEWLRIPVDVSFISLKIEEPAGNETQADVYIGRSFTQSDLVLDNIRMNSDNTLFIRAVDNAEAVSQVDTLTWYIKEQTSRVLFINDYPGTEGAEVLQAHQNLLRDIGITQYDYLEVTDGVASGEQKAPISAGFHRPVDPTLNKVLAEWDHIYWVSGDLNRNITYALRSTLDFFDNNGTMFVNIPTRRISEDDPIFDFLPAERMESIPPGTGNFRLTSNALFFPEEHTELDTLQLVRGSNATYPIIPAGDSRVYYTADFQTAPFPTTEEYSKIIAAGTQDLSIVYFGYQLHRFSYTPELVDAVKFLVIDELNFEQ